MKRFCDITISAAGLLVLSPLLLLLFLLVWLQDRHSPFYIACRVGLNRKPFRMVKLRSMVINADKTGVDSTSADDKRITAVGKFIRKTKMDEFMQLWNVLIGDMSLVGPRPNVERHGVELYTQEEIKLLSVRPGITDLASIVFSDEGDILAGSENPDLKYNQVIRPWKSRLGLLYVCKQCLWLDFACIILTAAAILSKPQALRGINFILNTLKAEPQLIKVCLRNNELEPFPPPGASEVANHS